jgi:1-phosphatidylinositol-3-phosphate 5-kinase
LIRVALSEEDQPFLSDGGVELWVNALESALDVLANNIARGGWLIGAKRGRMLRKAKRVEELKKLQTKKARKEQEDLSKLKGKGKGDAGDEAQLRYNKELPKNPPSSVTTENHAEGSALALQQIKGLVARPTVPTPTPSAKHLLICLVPIGETPPFEDGGFDVVPHNTGCAFTPGFFSLPSLPEKAESSILYGLDEWDGLYSNASLWTRDGYTNNLQ